MEPEVFTNVAVVAAVLDVVIVVPDVIAICKVLSVGVFVTVSDSVSAGTVVFVGASVSGSVGVSSVFAL